MSVFQQLRRCRGKLLEAPQVTARDLLWIPRGDKRKRKGVYSTHQHPPGPGLPDP